MKGAAEDAPDPPLPVLRDDLELVPGAPQANGAPAWVVFDPAANRYFEIGRELLDMLTLWDAGTQNRLMDAVETRFGRRPEADDVEAAIRFLISNALTRDIPDNDYRAMAEKRAESDRAGLGKALHSYLFFKIPLVRPDRFLQVMWPSVRPLFTRTAVSVYVALGLLGLYLVSRQWEHFATTFQHMLSWQGAVLYGLSLVFVKSLHELGHAFMAVRYRLRVPTIGIAFMVLMPVLYTDTSGAWRLRSRRQRLMIDSAGIQVELALACLATCLWCFLPDGGFRLATFAVATTSWVTSLFVNLNPLMRFDGYYILSDAIGFQNMQTRGFDMARWRLRELLFGLGEAPPEPLSSRMRRLIVAHAWATWIYRFFLFVGIAVLVYAFFVKVIGILLFVVEIVFFILMPVGREIARWWEKRGAIAMSRRTYVTLGVVVSLVALAAIPWSTAVSVPSVMGAQEEARLYVPFPARIVRHELHEGRIVRAGEVVMTLSAPGLHQELRLARERARMLAARIDRSGSDAADRAMLVVLENELRSARERMIGLRRTLSRLEVRAPFDGIVSDVDAELHAGLWINPKTPLALVRAPARARVRGLVGEADLLRVEEGATATFVPENPDLPRVDLKVAKVGEVAVERLDTPYLALSHGGDIATEEKEPRPLDAHYAVTLAASHPAPAKALRGTTLIEGEARSFLSRAKRHVLKVFVRELGV